MIVHTWYFLSSVLLQPAGLGHPLLLNEHQADGSACQSARCHRSRIDAREMNSIRKAGDTEATIVLYPTYLHLAEYRTRLNASPVMLWIKTKKSPATIEEISALARSCTIATVGQR